MAPGTVALLIKMIYDGMDEYFAYAILWFTRICFTWNMLITIRLTRECYRYTFVTVRTPLSCEVFWHEYAKIPRHTSQNSIAAGNLEWILAKLLWTEWTVTNFLQSSAVFAHSSWQKSLKWYTFECIIFQKKEEII